MSIKIDKEILKKSIIDFNIENDIKELRKIQDAIDLILENINKQKNLKYFDNYAGSGKLFYIQNINKNEHNFYHKVAQEFVKEGIHAAAKVSNDGRDDEYTFMINMTDSNL